MRECDQSCGIRPSKEELKCNKHLLEKMKTTQKMYRWFVLAGEKSS